METKKQTVVKWIKMDIHRMSTYKHRNTMKYTHNIQFEISLNVELQPPSSLYLTPPKKDTSSSPPEGRNDLGPAIAEPRRQLTNVVISLSFPVVRLKKHRKK